MPKQDALYYVMLHGHKGFMYKNVYYPYEMYTCNQVPALFEFGEYMLNEEGQIQDKFRLATEEEIASGIDPHVDGFKNDFDMREFSWVDDAEEEINR